MKPIYRWLAAACGMLFVGFMVWYFHIIVFYILSAAVVAIVGKPIVRTLSRLKIRDKSLPSWLIAAFTLCILGTLFLSLLSAFVPIVIDKLKYISSFNIQQFDAMLAEPIREIETNINNAIPAVNFSIREMINTQVEPFFRSGIIANTLNSLTVLVVDFLMAAFSISFISFFFLKDDRLFSEGVLMIFPKRYEENIKRAINSITNLLVRYFIGICIESAIKLIFVAIPLYFFGFDWGTALTIALITAVLNVIPYIGPIIGGLIAFAIATISPIEGVHLTTVIVEVGIVLLVFQLIDNIILQPYIYASSVKAHPLEIFIVILMAGYIAGITGMLLAIPAYTVLRVIAKEFFNNFRVVQKLTEHI